MPHKPRSKKAVERNSFVEVPCVIAVDQSYTRTGLAICVNGKVRKAASIRLINVKYASVKRRMVAELLTKAIKTCLKHYVPEQIVVVVERIRTFTTPYNASKPVGVAGGADRDKLYSPQLRPALIKSHAALIGRIVDTAFDFGIKVYSVDTRAWKARVLGSSKPQVIPTPGVKNPEKIASVRKALELGFEEQMRVVSGNQKAFRSYDDDMADAICMSLYPFSGYPYLLQLEN